MCVTDVTRMHGERVCVGGYLEDGTPIRPVCGIHGMDGPTEAWLQPASDTLIKPFSVVEIEVGSPPHRLVAPHTEDRVVPTEGHRLLRQLPVREQITLLEQSLSPSVRAIFEAEVLNDPNTNWGLYVREGEGVRSLGTVHVTQILAVLYKSFSDKGNWDYRLQFQDASGETFQLAVVDLAFRQRLDALRDGGPSPNAAASQTLQTLRQQTVYLRIGLARGWAKHPDRCYLQVTGVYGFES